jgi:aryl sulfotransferase
MTGLTLIASYPKSGNTWMRSLLASLRLGGRTPDINSELGAGSVADRKLHDVVAQMECSDLTPREVARLRPEVSRWLARACPGIYKTHDANLIQPGTLEPAIPADAINRVILITRDPRDVAVSLAHHLGVSCEEAVQIMGDESALMGRSDGTLNANVEQYLSSWSEHTQSWLDAVGPRRLHVRYEDLSDRPGEVFQEVCRFLDMSVPATELASAVEATRFRNLASQEASAGFRERHPTSRARFFREGRARAWRDHLPQRLADRMVADHGPMMLRLGYCQRVHLDTAG